MTNRVRAIWLSVLIGIYAPGQLLPEDNPQNVPQKTAGGVTFATPGGWTVASDSGTITCNCAGKRYSRCRVGRKGAGRCDSGLRGLDHLQAGLCQATAGFGELFFDLIKTSGFDNPFGSSFQSYLGEVMALTCPTPKLAVTAEEPFYVGKD